MGNVTALDEYGRTLFRRDSNGFWSVMEYAEPRPNENPISMPPTRVVHKYSDLYGYESSSKTKQT